MRRIATLAGIVLVMIGLTACQSQQAVVTVTATAIDPQALLMQAGQTIRATKSVKLKLQVTGAPAFIQTDTAGLVQFLSLDGSYSAPDRVAATVKAKLLGISGQVDVVAIGDDQWYKNAVLTGGKYLKDTFSPGFNAGRLVSSDQGITSALTSVTDLKLAGQENQFGTNVYHLTGVADGTKITSLTVGLITSKASVNVDIYIDTTSLHAVDVVLTQPETVSATQPKPTQWDLELFDYDLPVTITPPANAIILTKAATSAATANATITPTAGSIAVATVVSTAAATLPSGAATSTPPIPSTALTTFPVTAAVTIAATGASTP